MPSLKELELPEAEFKKRASKAGMTTTMYASYLLETRGRDKVVPLDLIDPRSVKKGTLGRAIKRIKSDQNLKSKEPRIGSGPSIPEFRQY
jgi:hypothetical protein